MALITYLQAVNKVLIKLREDEVADVTSSSYSKLIGQFVNDAKHEVENAFNWSTLRQTVNVTSVASQREYALSLSTDSVLLRDPDVPSRPMAFITSDNFEKQMRQLPVDYVLKHQIISDFDVTDPAPYSFGLQASLGNWVLQFLEAPTANGINWRFFFKVPQAELSANATEILVPWRPVVDLAILYALNERGEELGEPGGIAERRYRDSLSSAVGFDGMQNSHQLVATPE